jgi:hypothetical protein
MKSPETNPSSERPLKDKYQSKADAEGYVFINDFAIVETSHQSKSVAGLADGDEGTEELNLGKDLRVKGSSGNYPDMKIHIDNLDEFVKRVKNHFEN